MSSAFSPGTSELEHASPPGRRSSRTIAFLLAALIALAGVFVGASPAQAGSHGVGYEIGQGFLGAYKADDGRQAYCIDLGANSPFSPTSGPQTVTSLDSLSRQQLAELNYVLARWGQSGDANVTSAVALYVWSVTDPGIYNSHGMSGDTYYVGRAPTAQRPTILAHLATMRADAAANAVVSPMIRVGIDMADQYTGTLTLDATPGRLTGPVVLSGAKFDDGSSTRALGAGQFNITGTPAPGAPAYEISASMSVSAEGYGAKVDLYVSGAGEQRIIASVAGSPGRLNATTATRIDLDFQPVIGTKVASRVVQEGEPLVDNVTVSVTKGSWIELDGRRPVPIVAVGTLYGPFDSQPAESESPPLGAPVVGTEQLTLTGPGSYTSPGTMTAPSSGFYTWVWSIDKASQSDYGRYLTGSFTDRFGRVEETALAPFQPKAVTTAMQRLIKAGDPVTDQVVVSSVNGPWLKVDGEPVPVLLEGTLYQVPGTRPPVQSPAVDPQAVPIGTTTLTATGPGTYISPEMRVPASGFVTWVWRIKVASQEEWVRTYLAGDWTDQYGLPAESTSARWPISTISQIREYNVHPGGRAFDIITVTGFPADHGTFRGDGYWSADVNELVHTVYGPVADDAELTDDLDLSTVPVFTTISTPARNGNYGLGFSDQDRITPTEPGYYFVVTSFAGDDRVQPYRSSPADIMERFFVPPTSPPATPPSVITQAQPNALVGQPFDDTALVQGDLPDDATLVFRAYGPQPVDETPVCTEPFYVGDPIPVAGAGFYRSGQITVDDPGAIYWVATLYDGDQSPVVEGSCGAPGETTTVTAPPEELAINTTATPEVMLGEPATDTATITGTIPDGSVLVFEAFLQDGDEPACTTDELAYTGEPIPLEGPGQYTSAEVVLDQAGTYLWVASVRDADGQELIRALCGAPGETTTVTAPPEELAVTTSATPEVMLGEPAVDIATVSGTVPQGAELAFEAFLQNGDEPACTADELAYTGDAIPLDGPGEYRSAEVVFEKVGTYFWVETIRDAEGETLARGDCGAEGETTIVTAPPEDLTVTTSATPEVMLGEPAVDIATVSGTVPQGAELAFEAFLQNGDEPACTADELAYTGDAIPLDGPGEYRSAEVVFEKVGTYFWVETIRDAEGETLARGDCGAEGETTAVKQSPPPPTQPPGDKLAMTGGGDWILPIGIISAIFLLAGGGTLFFGRRLAQLRERNGYVRDEDYGGVEEIEGLLETAEKQDE